MVAAVEFMSCRYKIYLTLQQDKILQNLDSVIFKCLILLWLMYFESLFNAIYVTKQMAKEVVEAFPVTPSEIKIPSRMRLLSKLRKGVAGIILEASGMYCKHTIKENLALILQCECSFTTHGHDKPRLPQTDL